ncbi:IS66 family insertion sequence element accessory protein TnpA [Bacteroides pyogenes]|uniref:IS66 family insertion sequence element accessory protein TnpA n=1 Tax=Bacteroides pyogenes TaxID=310300 RepID=UPI003B43810F
MKRIMSKEKFLAVYERQQSGGLTIRDFCEHEAYLASCFHYWKKKNGLSRVYTNRADKVPNATFIPLSLFPDSNLPSATTTGVIIELPSRINIHLDSRGNSELRLGLVHKLCGHVLSELLVEYWTFKSTKRIMPRPLFTGNYGMNQ